MSIFIADNERAEAPPAFFLQSLYDYDSMLVVLPSRTKPAAYVIARRKQFGPGLTQDAIDMYTQPDTKMCIQHGCVPVCLMFKTGPTWNVDTVLQSLKARDIWAHGGADKVADMLEQQENDAKAATLAEASADVWNRSGDAWRSYQARTGQSTIRHNDTRTAQPRKGRRIYSNSPSGSMAGSGSVTLD